MIGERRRDQAKYTTIRESESVETEGEPIDVKKKKSVQIQIYALVVHIDRHEKLAVRL